MPALILRQLKPIAIFKPAVLTLFGVVGIAGCAFQTPSASDPAVVMLDRSLSEARRIEAVQTRPLADADDAGVRAALHVLVWSDRHPLALRIAAMDRLIGEDAEGFWRSADRWLVSVDDPAMVAAIGMRAARDQRRDAIPALLRRWARPQATPRETDRVEYAVIELVAPRPVTEALWDRVAAPKTADAADTPTRAAAWTVLCRLENETVLRERLAEAVSASGMVEDLRAAGAVLDRLPRDAEGLRWLAALRRDRAGWDAITATRETLPAEARGQVEVRHLPVLANLPDPQWRWNAAAFVEALNDAINPADQVVREVPVGERVDRLGLGEWSWADLAVAWCVVEAMRDAGVVSAWFVQADADLADTTTEHGGVLTWNEEPAQHGKWRAVGFEPGQRQGDRKFFSPEALIQAMYTGLAHYHFHAQSYDHAEFAGPGRGDLDFARRMSAHTLTLTFIDRDRLNVDLTFPDGGVLDLGCVRRPTHNTEDAD